LSEQYLLSLKNLKHIKAQKESPTSDTKPSGKKELTTVAILCESPKTGVKQKLPDPFLQNDTPTCAEGTVSLY
jgi:type IV pilus assembly protein PilA